LILVLLLRSSARLPAGVGLLLSGRRAAAVAVAALLVEAVQLVGRAAVGADVLVPAVLVREATQERLAGHAAGDVGDGVLAVGAVALCKNVAAKKQDSAGRTLGRELPTFVQVKI
jgi:hypothetical protein